VVFGFDDGRVPAALKIAEQPVADRHPARVLQEGLNAELGPVGKRRGGHELTAEWCLRCRQDMADGGHGGVDAVRGLCSCLVR